MKRLNNGSLTPWKEWMRVIWRAAWFYSRVIIGNILEMGVNCQQKSLSGKEKIFMYTPLPQTSEAFASLSWPEIEPWYRELQETALSQETLQPWLAQWSRLSEVVDEVMAAKEIACMRDTADQEAERRQQRFLDEIY